MNLPEVEEFVERIVSGFKSVTNNDELQEQRHIVNQTPLDIRKYAGIDPQR